MKKLTACLIFALCATFASAQTDKIAHPDSFFKKQVPPELEFTILDSPFTHEHGFNYPSMDQSLELTHNFYRTAHWKLVELTIDKSRTFQFVSLLGFEILSSYFPLGEAWLHEEWHRAVMSRRNISSYNGIYDFKLFSDVIPVRKVSDEDLTRLKRDHPAEHVRMSAAGMEAQAAYINKIDRELFFKSDQYLMRIQALINAMEVSLYMFGCGSAKTSRDTTKTSYDEEGANIDKRDFTGLDCNAWAYDLSRPNEPYAARGTHPSGVGIDRYITIDKMSANERKYLRQAGAASLLNFVDPMMYGYSSLSGEKGHNHGISFRHFLTSFGQSYDFNHFYAADDVNIKLVSTIHSYRNSARHFWGLETKLVDYPIEHYWISPRLMLWQQPRDQTFKTSKSSWGGLLDLTYTAPISRRWKYFVNVTAKTAGWVAGNVYLDGNLSTRLGVKGYLF